MASNDPTLVGPEVDLYSAIMQSLLQVLWGKDLDSALTNWLERDDGALQATADVPLLRSPPLDLEDVAALKDELRITNKEWPMLVKRLKLADGNTIHYIQMTQHKIDKEMPVVPTPGGGGHQYHSLKAYIKWILQQVPPKHPDEEILLKFSWDGTTLTSGKRLQMEVGAFNLLYPDYMVAQVPAAVIMAMTNEAY